MHDKEKPIFFFPIDMITIVQDSAQPCEAALDERAPSPVEIFLWPIRTNQIHGNFKDRLLQFIEVPISPTLTTKKALSIQVRLNYFTLHADIISEKFTIKKCENNNKI